MKLERPMRSRRILITSPQVSITEWATLAANATVPCPITTGTAQSRVICKKSRRTPFSLDQLMRFEMDGMTGHGIFELLVQGDRYPRYRTWS